MRHAIALGAILLAVPSFLVFNAFCAEASTNRFNVTTPSGETYENCRILRTEPDGIVVVHSTGIRKLPFSVLPSRVREKHEVELPSYMTAEEAARYWPDNVDEVIAEIEQDITHWYGEFGDMYAYEDGTLLRVGRELMRVRGKILSIADTTHILVIDSAGDVVAFQLPDTTDLVDDDYFSLLGKNIGTHRYTSVMGAAKQVGLYTYVPQITFEDFKTLGEDAFPEIANAKRAAYQRLLNQEARDEARQQRLRAAAAAREAAARASQRKQEEAERRREQAARAERAQRAREAQQEKFRMKRPEDFR